MSTPQQSTFLADVVPVVGQDVAAELVRQLGGTTFPVPKRQSRQGELRYRMLAEVIGEEAADLLVYHYGGSDLYIPRGARTLQDRRDAAINEAFVREVNAGRSSTEVVNDLARQYKLTDRRVWQILKTVPPSDKSGGQFRLF